jgi:hypothetical protein
MPVARIYTKADAKSAIDTANNHFFGQLLRVRNDVTNAQFSSADAMGTGEFDYKGSGSDVGHAFRHVTATAPDGKSTFADEDSLHAAVMYLLNCREGQSKLAALDVATPEGGEKSYDGRSVMTATISQSIASLNLYGNTVDGVKQKAKRAMCIVQKLGPDSLWVHTAYPTSFVT